MTVLEVVSGVGIGVLILYVALGIYLWVSNP